ncbi:GIY-YIG nuclease family protein [Patescibacteria group bacterium]|nr:GIY-YIG nuclease family protein [Patescibacteria group bacterium]
MHNHNYYVYIITNKRNGVLYAGVTSDLPGRIWQHKQKIVEGFSKKHKLDMLVYYEHHLDIYEAITREKKIKKWNRKWKLRLIENLNPYWCDLYKEVAAFG